MHRPELTPGPHRVAIESGQTFTPNVATRSKRIIAWALGDHGRPLLAIGVLCAIFTGPTAAGPVPLPGAVTDAFITAGGEGPLDAEHRATGAGSASNYIGFGPDSLSFIGVGLIAAGGFASISRTMLPGPFVPTLEISAAAAVSSHVADDVLPGDGTLGGYAATGFTRVKYQFRWDGPPGLVNLDFSGRVEADGSGAGNSSGGVSAAHIALIDLSGVTRVYDEVARFADGEHLNRSWIDAAGVEHISQNANYGFNSFQENGVYAIQANTIYTIDMAVSAGATTSAGYDIFAAAAAGHAFADPYLAIDPSTPNAGAYTLSISPGIENALPLAAPVPEPETYAMIMAGLGVIGFASRRRRSRH